MSDAYHHHLFITKWIHPSRMVWYSQRMTFLEYIAMLRKARVQPLCIPTALRTAPGM